MRVRYGGGSELGPGCGLIGFLGLASTVGVVFVFFNTKLVNSVGSFLFLFWLLGLLLPCFRLFSEICAYFPGKPTLIGSAVTR